MQSVGRFSSRGEADVARAMLSEHGIEARVDADDVAGLHPELSLATGGLALVVDDVDAEEARELLADVPDASPTADAGGTEVATAGPGRRVRRRVVAALLLLMAILLAVSVTWAIADIGLHWL